MCQVELADSRLTTEHLDQVRTVVAHQPGAGVGRLGRIKSVLETVIGRGTVDELEQAAGARALVFCTRIEAAFKLGDFHQLCRIHAVALCSRDDLISDVRRRVDLAARRPAAGTCRRGLFG